MNKNETPVQPQYHECQKQRIVMTMTRKFIMRIFHAVICSGGKARPRNKQPSQPLDAVLKDLNFRSPPGIITTKGGMLSTSCIARIELHLH